MSGREQVLRRIGKALGREAGVLSTNEAPQVVRDRLAMPPLHTLPAIGENTIDTLIEKMLSLIHI